VHRVQQFFSLTVVSRCAETFADYPARPCNGVAVARRAFGDASRVVGGSDERDFVSMVCSPFFPEAWMQFREPRRFSSN
jgi:hypothetical protein